MNRLLLQKKIFFGALLLIFSYIVHAQSSLVFNGSDTYVEVAANSAYNEDSEFTVEAWLKLSSNGSGYVFSTQAWTSSGGNGIDFTIDGQNLKVTLGIGDWYDVEADTVTIPYNEWTYVAVVYNGSTAKLYVNGVEKKSSDASGYIPTDGGAIRIGDNPTWNPRIFKGQIDEVRFWSVARSAEEIADNMYTSLTGSETGLIGYWNFDEGSGSVATDNSTTGNNGTIVNCTWAEDYNTIDVALGSASLPKSGYSLSSKEILTVDVTNNSPGTVYDVPISYIVDDGENVDEVIGSIEAGKTIDYTFTQTVDLSQNKDYVIQVYTSLSNDVNLKNDTLRLEVYNLEAGDDLAILFNETNSGLISIENSGNLINRTIQTIEAWVYPTEFQDNVWEGTVISNESASGGYAISIGGDGQCRMILYSDGNWESTTSSTGSIELDTWNHIAGVFDGSNIYLYLNGSLLTSAAAGQITPSTGIIYLGESVTNSGNRFIGRIDELSIWNKALTESEINANKDYQMYGTEDGLVAYYQFNEGYDSETINDLTGNEHTGTVENLDVSSSWMPGAGLPEKEQTSLNQSYEDKIALVYPTTTQGFVNIKFTKSCSIATVRIKNVSGQEVFVNAEYNICKDDSKQFNILNLVDGLYIITIDTPEGNYSQKIIKSGSL